jgi:hypothetical protein
LVLVKILNNIFMPSVLLRLGTLVLS